MQGWISLHRKIQDTAIYQDSQAVHLWIHLLLKANHKNTQLLFNGKLVKLSPGQLITGRKVLAIETGINESKIQRLLKMLENCNMIEQQTNNKNRLISIVNWDSYQGCEQQTNNKRTTTEQQLNTDNNDNNVNNDNKNIYGFDLSKWPALPSEQVWKDFVKHRNAKRSKITQTVINGYTEHLITLSEYGFTVDDCLTEVVTRGWTGLKAEWITKDLTRIDKHNLSNKDYGKGGAL